MAKSPTHYGENWKIGDFIREQDLSFHLGNVVKYVCRAGKKEGNTKQRDLAQAIHYLQNELEHTIEPAAASSPIPSSLLSTDEWGCSTHTESFDR